MRKILAIAVAAVLMLAAAMPSVAMAAVDYSYVRVRLDSMNHPASVQFKLAGAYRIAEAPSVDLFPKITYTLKNNGTGLKLTYKNGAATVNVSLPSKIRLVQYSNGSSANYLYLKNTTNGWRYYSGDMTFGRVTESGGDYIELVNNVYMETYLYGVVAGEMANDWPLEALKAQAVCARTYAMAYIKSRQGLAQNYDVVDTTSNQVYKGYPFKSDGKPQQNVIDAVNATRGQVILLGDPAQLNFADGMYSASNGGQVRLLSMRYANVSDTYHVFKDDPYDLKNAASPGFAFIFPVANDAATLSLLNSTDKSKAADMLALIKEKLPAALQAQYGISCAADAITVNGVKSAAPSALRPGMPSGSREFTQIAVTVSVTVSGAAQPAPVLAVKGNGNAVDSGSTAPSAANDTDFGSVSVAGGTVQKTYTVVNTGNAPLTISGITVSGDSAADFAVLSPIPAIVAAGASQTFSVSFDPSAAGDRGTTVSIASNAGGPYTFRIKGRGLSDQKNITAYKFKDFDSQNCLGVISGTNITVHLPTDADLTNLIAVYSTDPGAAVTVDAVVQQSGVTLNNFSVSPNQKTYVVNAEDGSAQSYLVTVIPDLPAQSIQLNPEASSDSAAKVEQNDGAENEPASVQGGGGMPVSATCDVTVSLVYTLQASDGDWDAPGELRSRFSKYSTLLDSSNLWLLYQSASGDGRFLYVTARGYGHGIGMSQRGAQQMANEQKSYADIIDFYFNTGAGKSALATVSVKEKTLPKLPGKGKSARYAKVTGSKLNMRAVAGTRGTVVGTLTKNTIVEVLSTSKGWSKVLIAARGLVGYVSASYLKTTTQTPPPASAATAAPTPTPTGTAAPTATPAAVTGKVKVSSLYIRSKPSTKGAVVYNHLKKGNTVTILDQNAAANWYKVKYGSHTGYAMYKSGSKVYIELIGATPTATATPAATASLQPVSAKANVTGYLTMRSSASTGSSKVGQIPGKSSFTVLQVATSATWLKASYSGKTGYVLAKYALIGGNRAYRACTVTAALLNARSGAGPSYGVVGTLKSGDTAVVISTVSNSSGKWYRIKIGSATAYIDSRYARISKP